MDTQRYIETQNTIVMMGSMVLTLPLDEFIAAIDKADDLVPILDPTAYRAGAKKMHHIRELATILHEFQKEILETQKGSG